MTFSEGTLPAEAATAVDGRLHLAVHLPWYRSLPLSCLESLSVSLDGAPRRVERVEAAGFTGTVADAGGSEVWWDLRDPLRVVLDVPARHDDVHDVTVDLAVRVPYIEVLPGVPLVQRASARTTVTVR
ncbi:hypothetical protein GB931_17735 [Modestobacter sp. I12A-02628]|uniref:Uncharacterized protein n=1 Tax=Goekera deserti TaxID=2497753 RepID=A0A7K3WEM2_9ACTN|nr:hypothetical protein [Goekera deserti]MPQ99727.1 hypothetical protein [Goekera deserti]NDI46262.1 hypothetical protein [Goekera deserti]NEL54806.1 hypothetical protein [Goekera deserti]